MVCCVKAALQWAKRVEKTRRHVQIRTLVPLIIGFIYLSAAPVAIIVQRDLYKDMGEVGAQPVSNPGCLWVSPTPRTTRLPSPSLFRRLMALQGKDCSQWKGILGVGGPVSHRDRRKLCGTAPQRSIWLAVLKAGLHWAEGINLLFTRTSRSLTSEARVMDDSSSLESKCKVEDEAAPREQMHTLVTA